MIASTDVPPELGVNVGFLRATRRDGGRRDGIVLLSKPFGECVPGKRLDDSAWATT